MLSLYFPETQRENSRLPSTSAKPSKESFGPPGSFRTATNEGFPTVSLSIAKFWGKENAGPLSPPDK